MTQGTCRAVPTWWCSTPRASSSRVRTGSARPPWCSGLGLDPQGQPEVAVATGGPGREGDRAGHRGHHRQHGTSRSARAPALPAPHGLDRHRDHAGARRAAGSAQPRSRAPPPTTTRAWSGADARGSTPIAQDEQQTLGVAQHQRKAGGASESSQAARSRQRRVARLATHQHDQQGGATRAAKLATTTRAGPVADARQCTQGPGGQREEGEEPQCLVPEGPVAEPGDRLVEAGVPGEQALVDPEAVGRARVAVIDHEVGAGPERPRATRCGPTTTERSGRERGRRQAASRRPARLTTWPRSPGPGARTGSGPSAGSTCRAAG